MEVNINQSLHTSTRKHHTMSHCIIHGMEIEPMGFANLLKDINVGQWKAPSIKAYGLEGTSSTN